MTMTFLLNDRGSYRTPVAESYWKRERFARLQLHAFSLESSGIP
jgi:hypothetical protein